MSGWYVNCRYLLAVLLVLVASAARATTWDEPWHERVVKEADHFVLATVTKADKQQLTLQIIRDAAGGTLDGSLQVTDFYLLDLCSTSGGHGPEFHLDAADTAYFFLKKNPQGGFSLATPSTGFAGVSKGIVYATYRHSYHQAGVEQPVYEMTMGAIFRKYHGLPYDAAPVRAFITEQLAHKPAPISEEGMADFFRQHVALETIYHLGFTEYYASTLPFLHDADNFHAQVSAARALMAINTPEAHQELLQLLQDNNTTDFTKVVAIRTLAAHQPHDLKPTLQKLVKKASEEENGFGGNIMDPRICTRIPTVQKALMELVSAL
ncbi:HEAT repeat domain-containing protein [Hymenobacter sp. APR13]|uniref:HEAT repeat domain-containing protein n=1 Tax=Hymenobacter sp. APR13 TaxID=1356852 RepID=UPI0004E0960B|nr:HEAT repeat domain-containing protein [Hymenobacter sp. APR13]AII53453.1 hypothetical protein N008_15895 [Hymenobacter sp. APR13]